MEMSSGVSTVDGINTADLVLVVFPVDSEPGSVPVPNPYLSQQVPRREYIKDTAKCHHRHLRWINHPRHKTQDDSCHWRDASRLNTSLSHRGSDV